MKSLSIRVGIILIIIGFTFSNIEVWGAEWKYVDSTEYSIWFYDAESIIRLPKNIVRVWVKMTYTDKVPKGPGIKYQEYRSLSLHELDCQEKKVRILSYCTFYEDGTVRVQEYDDTKWSYIIPDTVDMNLYKSVCK